MNLFRKLGSKKPLEKVLKKHNLEVYNIELKKIGIEKVRDLNYATHKNLSEIKIPLAHQRIIFNASTKLKLSPIRTFYRRKSSPKSLSKFLKKIDVYSPQTKFSNNKIFTLKDLKNYKEEQLAHFGINKIDCIKILFNLKKPLSNEELNKNYAKQTWRNWIWKRLFGINEFSDPELLKKSSFIMIKNAVKRRKLMKKFVYLISFVLAVYFTIFISIQITVWNKLKRIKYKMTCPAESELKFSPVVTLENIKTFKKKLEKINKKGLKNEIDLNFAIFLLTQFLLANSKQSEISTENASKAKETAERIFAKSPISVDIDRSKAEIGCEEVLFATCCFCKIDEKSELVRYLIDLEKDRSEFEILRFFNSLVTFWLINSFKIDSVDFLKEHCGVEEVSKGKFQFNDEGKDIILDSI